MKQLSGSIIIEEGKFLLLYREDEDHWESQRSPDRESCSTSIPTGCWRVPGGKVEENESPTQAAIREAEEEIGVKIELEKPFYTGEFQHRDQLFEWNSYIASIKDGRPELKEDKFRELEWFSREELSECSSLAPNIRMIESGLKRLLK